MCVITKSQDKGAARKVVGIPLSREQEIRPGEYSHFPNDTLDDAD